MSQHDCPAQPWPEDGDVRELVRRLTERLASFATRTGHRAQIVPEESLGVCNGHVPKYGRCSPGCLEWQADIDAGLSYLLAHPEQAPARQLALLADGMAS